MSKTSLNIIIHTFFLKINSNPFMCLDVQMHFPVLNHETNQVKYQKLFSSQWYFRLEQYNSFDKLLTKYQEHHPNSEM